MKKTGIQVNSLRKIVSIFVQGKMTLEDSKAFISDYNMKTRSINAEDFELEVDCTDMQLLKPDMYDDLTSVMKMYKATGFKHVKFTIKGNPVLNMQLSRLANKAGLTQHSVVEI